MTPSLMDKLRMMDGDRRGPQAGQEPPGSGSPGPGLSGPGLTGPGHEPDALYYGREAFPLSLSRALSAFF